MKITIRPLEEKDAHTSVKWRNIPEIWQHTGSAPDHEITLNEEQQWIQRVIADASSRRFAIEADGVYVGNVYLTDIHDGVADYHIFIGDTAYWGKGVARKASELIIAYGQNELGLRAIELEVKPGNAAAHHLYASMGFAEVSKAENGFIRMRKELA